MSFYLPIKGHYQSQIPDLDMGVLESDLTLEGYRCRSRAHKEGFFIDCKRKGGFACFRTSIGMNFFRKARGGLMSITYTPPMSYRVIGMLAIAGIVISTAFPYEPWVRVYKSVMWLFYGFSYIFGEELIVRQQSHRFSRVFLRLRNSFEIMPSQEFYLKLNDEDKMVSG